MRFASLSYSYLEFTLLVLIDRVVYDILCPCFVCACVLDPMAFEFEVVYVGLWEMDDDGVCGLLFY